ncbi:GNAT family N-acetyltransferase [Gymnodinialimonas sp.]
MDAVSEPMLSLRKGRYLARIATSDADRVAAQRLRALAFRASVGIDDDPHDAACTHVLVEDEHDGTLVCCCRLLPLGSGAQIAESYSAQFYDLRALLDFSGPMLEMGRFCIHPARTDADILRVAWGALTGYVDAHGVEMLFGCASFPGTDTRLYHDAFALLRDRHLAPEHWRPRIKAPSVFRYAAELRQPPDLKAAQASMPSLLRTYLLMGGWVSDHAVIDDQMGTLHVFTGLEIRAVPPTRARLLRSVAG